MVNPCFDARGRCSNPAYVKIRDRVVMAEIQRVLWRREQTTVAYEPEEFERLFDCLKRTCVGIPKAAGGGPFLEDDELLFVFEDPQQVHSAELVLRALRSAFSLTEPMATSLAGDWEAVFADPSLLNKEASGKEEFLVDGKVSAIAYRFTAEATPEICEAVFKTFIHEMPITPAVPEADEMFMTVPVGRLATQGSGDEDFLCRDICTGRAFVPRWAHMMLRNSTAGGAGSSGDAIMNDGVSAALRQQAIPTNGASPSQATVDNARIAKAVTAVGGGFVASQVPSAVVTTLRLAWLLSAGADDVEGILVVGGCPP